VSLSAPTEVREVHDQKVVPGMDPSDFGLEPCALSDLRVDSPEQSAA